MFELCYQNYINTTGQLTVSENTVTSQYLFYNDLRFEWSTDTFANDLTTASITIDFGETLTVDRIALVGHNLKKFRIFRDLNTSAGFGLETGQVTSTTNFITNSDTAHYFRTETNTCQKITIDMYETITPNQNKRIGYLVVTRARTTFGGRVPIAQNYFPRLNLTGVDHRMSDGTVRSQILEDTWSATFGLSFVTREIRDELREIYNDHLPLIFCPFGTTSGWDGLIFPCNWTGSFDFYQYSDNASEAGYSGTLNLVETSSI